MPTDEQVRDRPTRSSADAGAAETGAAATARARAYLDLWERQLVHAAVRSQFAPAGRAPAGGAAAGSDRPPRA